MHHTATMSWMPLPDPSLRSLLNLAPRRLAWHIRFLKYYGQQFHYLPLSDLKEIECPGRLNSE